MWFSKKKNEDLLKDKNYLSLDEIKTEIFNKVENYVNSLPCTVKSEANSGKRHILSFILSGFADIDAADIRLYDFLMDTISHYMRDVILSGGRDIEYIFVAEWFPKGKDNGCEIHIDVENSDYGKDYVYVRNQNNFLNLTRLFPDAYCNDISGNRQTNWRIPIASPISYKRRMVLKTLIQNLKEADCVPNKISMSLYFERS